MSFWPPILSLPMDQLHLLQTIPQLLTELLDLIQSSALGRSAKGIASGVWSDALITLRARVRVAGWSFLSLTLMEDSGASQRVKRPEGVLPATASCSATIR